MEQLQPTTPIATAQTIYLKDYQAPIFSVQQVDLDIRVFDHHTIVTSKLLMQRQQAGDLVLFGRDLELQRIVLNGTVLQAADYQLDAECLTIFAAPDRAELEIEVMIHPERNTHLEGLYQAGADLFVTQNEPEGFRKITFYPDRPDVLSVFTTRVEADKKFPTLLANGNLQEKGDCGDNRHYAIWHDPTYKPSYLFACVIGHLEVLRDHYVTSEGRNVTLEIYAEAKDIPKCQIAMQALKDAMRWDEEVYGRAYDLDVYMIVATGQFNMGAMENKGLNIFNTSCVLADPSVTTDNAILQVQAVIAHEYFHNWTGNRITCRDWFQLCLKEGLTVFRDQSFSETLQSEAAQRIDDVAVLKSHQFPEDSGPLAHPPRPDHFVEINNFYTATVYEKGAEISRMMAKLLGKQRFRQGTDQYFERFDGQAVTVEDWITALSDGSGVDLSAFLKWYVQPGTPTVTVTAQHDKEAKTLTLAFTQSLKSHAKYSNLQPLPIPIALALFDQDSGAQLDLECSALSSSDHKKDGMYLLEQSAATISFENVANQPVISLLRNFSAPVNLNFEYSDDELAFLLQYETSGFNQWQAAQTLLENILLHNHHAHTYLDAITAPNLLPQLLHQEPILAARLLDIPSESYLGSRIAHDYRPEVIFERREALLNALAKQGGTMWQQFVNQLQPQHELQFSRAMGQRLLKSIAMQMMARQGDTQVFDLANDLYYTTDNMTERLNALRVLVWYEAPQAEAAMQDFYQRFKTEDLAIDQWFLLQSSQPNLTADKLSALITHPDYDLTRPNRIRAVTGGLAMRPMNLWQDYAVQYFVDLAKIMDQKNPIVGSRQVQALARWYTFAEPERSRLQSVLKQLHAQVTSKNVMETVQSILTIDL